MGDLAFIIKGCMNDEAKQQGVLYERYFGYAFTIAFSYIYHSEQAGCVANDAFVKLFRNIQRFIYIENDVAEPQLKAWLKRIVINAAVDELRKRKTLFENLPENFGQVCDADRSLLYKELVHEVQGLPGGYRVVFIMHVIEGFKHSEIAQRLGISVGTSKSNLSKAKTYLRKRVKNDVSLA